jgi:hypothetical protein
MSVASTAQTRAVNTAQSFFVKMLAVCNREAELRYLPMGAKGTAQFVRSANASGRASSTPFPTSLSWSSRLLAMNATPRRRL